MAAVKVRAKKKPADKASSRPVATAKGRNGPAKAASLPDSAREALRMARAEEDAIVITRTPVSLEDMAELGVEESFFDKVMRWKDVLARLRHRRAEPMAEHMAAVKAGVLHELEVLGQEKGIVLKGGPFRSVVLPVIRRKPHRWGLGLVMTLLLLVVVGMMVWVGTRPANPRAVVLQSMAAAASGDVALFEKTVDVDSLSAHVVGRLVGQPAADMVALPPALRRVVDPWGRAALTADIRRGLEANLHDEILEAVRRGRVAEGEGDMLGQIWQALGNGSMSVGVPHVSSRQQDEVIAEIPVQNKTIGITLPLQLVLTRTDGTWRISDAPNLVAVMDNMAKAMGDKNALEAARHEDMLETLGVGQVSKTRVSASKIMVTIELQNKSKAPIRVARLKVRFGDAAGQPMKIAFVELHDTLQPGETATKRWPVVLDPSQHIERYVADLPLSALTVKVVPVEVR